MLHLLIFLQIYLDSAMSVNLNQKCSCRKYATETICKELSNCKWENRMCQEKACVDYLNRVSCDQAANCAWNVSKCTQFTTCSDYYASDPFNCFKKGDDSDEKCCQPSETNYCQNYSYKKCAQGIDEITCSGFESFWSLCYWNQNKCQSVDVRKCSALVTIDLCLIYGKNLGCTWKNNVCKNYQCSDFTSEFNCIVARSDDIKEDSTLCKWNTSTVATEQVCLEAENTDHLTSDNCYNYTLYTHLWDTTTQKCLSCDLYKDAQRLLLEIETEGSFSNLILYTLSLIVIIM